MAYYPMCTREEVRRYMTKHDPPPRVAPKVRKEYTEEQKEDLAAVMKFFDQDGDGQVDINELREVATNVGINEDAIEEWFEKYDIDGSGSLDREEFLEFFRDEWLD